MQSNQFQAKGFLVWTICALFFLYEFSLRTVIGTYQEIVMQELDLNALQFSLLSSTLFIIIYGVMQIPAGLIVDNIGLKKSLIIGTLTCAIASIGFGHSNHYFTAMSFRMLMGFGSAFGFICVLIAVYDWMPHSYSAIFIGLAQFIGTLGPIMVAGPLETLSESADFNWRTVFSILGIIGFILTILVICYVDNNQQKTGKYIILRRPETILVSITRLFSKIQPWYIALLSVSLFFSIEYLSENEGRHFLLLKYDMSHTTASYMITWGWIGYALGCPILGMLSDFFNRRKSVVSLCALIGLMSIVIILYSHDAKYLLFAFVLLGISASGQSICFATIAEQFKRQFVAVGFGLNNAISNLITAINAPLIGILLDYKGSYLIVSDYLSAFNILIIIAIIGIVVAIFCIKETYCKSAADFTYIAPLTSYDKH